jgi:hypothetical protein
MQSTGHTSTQAVSFVPMHGSQMIYATRSPSMKRRSQLHDGLAVDDGLLVYPALPLAGNIHGPNVS